MTDLDKIRLCAEAMDFQYGSVLLHDYNPLHNDAQAMALVKKFGLDLTFGSGQWIAQGDHGVEAISKDLNRAIVECVAKMQAAK